MNRFNRFTRSLAAFIFLCCSTVFAVQPLEITDVFVQEVAPHDLLAAPHDHLIVLGNNFMNGGVIDLWLGGFDLVVVSQSDTELAAELPLLIGAGSYQLVATTGGGTVREDDFDGVTIGAVGLQGIQGLQGIAGTNGSDGAMGLQGVQGPKGDQGLKGDQGVKGDSGADGTNGTNGIDGTNGNDGAQGPQGQPGNLALANLSCPVSQFVIGIDDIGGLICQSILGQGESPPPSVTQTGSVQFSVAETVRDFVTGEPGPSVNGAFTIPDGIDLQPGDPVQAVYRVSDFAIQENSLPVFSFRDPTAGNQSVADPATITISKSSVFDNFGVLLARSSIVVEVNAFSRDSFGNLTPAQWVITMYSNVAFSSELLPSFEFLNNSVNFSRISIEKVSADPTATHAQYVGNATVMFPL